MKTQLIQLSSLAVLLYFFCAVLLLACNVLSSEQVSHEALSSGLRADEKARLFYEAETVTVTHLVDDVPDALREQYSLRSVPAVSRSRVDLSIDRSGEARWVIEELEPQRKSGSRPASPPSKIKKTVIHGDYGEFYDAGGKQVRSGRISMPDLAQVNQFLKYTGKGEDVQKKIAAARQNGSVVKEHPNGNITLRTWKSLPGLYTGKNPPEVESENVEIVELVDTRHNRIVATGIYDASGNLLEETRLKYGDTQRGLVQIHSVTMETDRNRVKIKRTNDIYFKYLNVLISNN